MAALNHQIASTNILQDELNLFGVPPITNAITHRKYEEINVKNSIDSGPIEFEIVIPITKAVDIFNSKFKFTVKITYEDGEDIGLGDARPDDVILDEGAGINAAAVAAGELAQRTWDEQLVVPVCNMGHAIFKDVIVFLDSQKIGLSNDLYPYASFFQTLLGFSTETKNTKLNSGQLYNLDTGINIDRFEDGINGFCQDTIQSEHRTRMAQNNQNTKYSNANYKNPACYERFDKTCNSKIFEIYIKPTHVLFNQPKFIYGGRRLLIRFERNDPAFFLMSKVQTKNYNLRFLKASFYMSTVELDPALQASVIKHLHKDQKFKIPVLFPNFMFFSKSAGITDLSQPNVVTGILPRRGIIANIYSEAYRGHYVRNPYYFPNLDIQSIIIRKNGDALPYERYESDFQNDNYTQLYETIFQMGGQLNGNIGTELTYKNFKNICLICFNISKCEDDQSANERYEEGNLSFEMKLGTALEHPVTTLVYLEYQDIISIDKNGIIEHEIRK